MTITEWRILIFACLLILEVVLASGAVGFIWYTGRPNEHRDAMRERFLAWLAFPVLLTTGGGVAWLMILFLIRR